MFGAVDVYKNLNLRINLIFVSAFQS